MSVVHLDPAHLSVNFLPETLPIGPITPRCYTLTHSDLTGELFLTIGAQYHLPQVAGWSTRLMRDEVLASWQGSDEPFLEVNCHVSGGLVFGLPGWRASLFRYHMPLVLEALRYADRLQVEQHPALGQAPVELHLRFRGRIRIERTWGVFDDYC